MSWFSRLRDRTQCSPCSDSSFRTCTKAAWTYEQTGRTAILKVLLTDGTPAMIWYRLMQWARRWRMTPLEMLCNRINTIFCGCIIGRGAEFGPGFVLIHSIGVVINGTVRGGANVKIEHQVTIGAERRECPVIGDDVFIGAGAKIIGSLTVGNGASRAQMLSSSATFRRTQQSWGSRPKSSGNVSPACSRTGTRSS